MKIGLISDIHGNYAALKVVLESAYVLGVEQFLFAGDLIGYYYEAPRCLRALRSVGAVCVAGNHDRMLLECVRDDNLRNSLVKRFGSSYSETNLQFSQEELSWLSSLPRVTSVDLRSTKILVTHGSPWADTDYVYKDSTELIARIFESFEFDICVLGNTHHQFIKRAGTRQLINPGSVGQPRGARRGTAQWAFLDSSSATLELRAENYDNAYLIAESQESDPDFPYLWQVLGRCE